MKMFTHYRRLSAIILNGKSQIIPVFCLSKVPKNCGTQKGKYRGFVSVLEVYTLYLCILDKTAIASKSAKHPHSEWIIWIK